MSEEKKEETKTEAKESKHQTKEDTEEKKEETKSELPAEKKKVEEKQAKPSLKVFEVFGEYVEKGEKKKFHTILKSLNEKTASEKIMSIMGSRHKIKRRSIYLNEIKEVKETQGEK